MNSKLTYIAAFPQGATPKTDKKQDKTPGKVLSHFSAIFVLKVFICI